MTVHDAPKDSLPLTFTLRDELLTPRETQLINLLVITFFEGQMNAYRWAMMDKHAKMGTEAAKADTHGATLDLTKRLTELLQRFFPELEARIGVRQDA